MPRGRSRTARAVARARTMSHIRRWILIVAAGLVLVLGAIELVTSGRLGGITDRFGRGGDPSQASTVLDRAINGTLVKLGVSGMIGAEEERQERGREWTHREKTGTLPYGTSLYETNLALTRAVREAGGDVLRVTETSPDWRGRKALELRIGTGDFETHDVLLRESGKPSSNRGRETRVDGHPRIAIVIDDFGYTITDAARGILDLPYPITVSVLPHCPRTKEAAELAHAAGKEVMVHVPMEPASYPETSPGEGALMVGQTRAEIEKLTEEAIDDVPYAVGASNHMGSAFTSYHIQMRVFMRDVARKGLYFLDSMTTPLSVGLSEAERAGVRAAANRMFIDSPLDEEGRIDVDAQLAELARIARKHGSAIGIGHPYPETLRALTKALPEFERDGIELVFVSDLVQ